MATATMSRFPVRSPLPKSVPSTRSAPASKPSSVAAVPVPRSLCVCSETMSASRLRMLVQIHSIWSAYTLGIATSTVSGKLRIIRRSAVGCHTSITASLMSFANSTSVALKLSGEYCSITFPPASSMRCIRSLIHVAPRTATAMISSFDMPKTTRRCAGEVLL